MLTGIFVLPVAEAFMFSIQSVIVALEKIERNIISYNYYAIFKNL
jgi:hypothetical protein